jgi:hypothetical protein
MSSPLTSCAGSTAWRSVLAAGTLLLSGSSLSAQGSFETNSPVPYNCYAPQTRFLDGKLYTISGFATSSSAAWDPATNAWTMIASFPGSLRQYAGVATWNGKLYMVGGDTGGGGWTNTLYSYTVASNSWTTLASMPLGSRYSLTADAVNGKIYAIGGYNGITLDRVEEYDIASNTWATKAPMPIAMSGAMSAVIDGQIYVAGGPSWALQIYNPSTNSWSIGPSMPAGWSPSNSHSADRVAGRMIGTVLDINAAVRLISYDPATSTWTLLPFLPSNRWANGFAVNPNTGLAHIVSGWTGASYSNLHEAYNPGELRLDIDALVVNATATFQTTGGRPNAAVSFYASLKGFQTTTYSLPGGLVTLDLKAPLRPVGDTIANGAGAATLFRVVPVGLGGRTVSFQAVDLAGGTYEVSNSFSRLVN